jgi:hypothetical protein
MSRTGPVDLSPSSHAGWISVSASAGQFEAAATNFDPVT